MLPDFDFAGPITALGTFNIDKKGNVSGKFDNNLREFAAFEDIEFFGTIQVDRDCTGNVVFETSDGFMRRDSIAVVGRNEMWGMSLDPNNQWTYQVRRISGRSKSKSS